MKVIVRYFTTMRELAGTSQEEMLVGEGATLGETIERLASKYGQEAQRYLYFEEGKLDPSIRILVNGTDAGTLLGAETKLRDGDVVALIPPIGGG